MTDSLVDRLQTVRDRLPGEPQPERLVEASCGPNVKRLTHLALHPADASTTADRWRAWARDMYPRHPRRCSSKPKSACAAADCGPGRTRLGETRGR